VLALLEVKIRVITTPLDGIRTTCNFLNKDELASMDKDKPKIRIYLDTGASIKGFKAFHNQCRFIVSPYDHESARRNDVKWELGIHSEVQ